MDLSTVQTSAESPSEGGAVMGSADLLAAVQEAFSSLSETKPEGPTPSSTVGVASTVVPDSTGGNPDAGCVGSDVGDSDNPPKHENQASAPALPPPPPQVSITSTTTGLQIVTRKRSSMCAAAAANNSTPSNTGGTTGNGGIPPSSGGASQASGGSAAAGNEKKISEQPPKKKKKYTPKPKKPANPIQSEKLETNPAGETVTTIVVAAKSTKSTTNNSESKKKPSSSSASKSKSKKPPSSNNSTGGNNTSSASSKSKSKSKKTTSPNQQQRQQSSGDETFPTNDYYFGGLIASAKPHQLTPPPPPLHPMPKLRAIQQRSNEETVRDSNPLAMVKIKQEPQDWDDGLGEGVDDIVTGKPSSGSGSSSSSSGRKKKSKGRNGNIYIGVFNRIEWMKLQEAYGFTTVNNFGTFVLETMRRVHGDIKFWCDLALASGVYPDLAKYEWRNGFPHAVDRFGRQFVPEVDPNMSDEKRAEVVELGQALWAQRLQQLKLQQQLKLGGGGDGGDGILEVIPEEVEVEDEEDDAEDTAGMDLDNYLENMDKLGCGKYSPPGIILAGIGGGTSSTGAGGDIKLSEEQINSIWNEQLNNVQSLEQYGKLFNLINSIDQSLPNLIEKPEEEEEDEVDVFLKAQQEAGGFAVDENDGMIELEAAASM